MDSDFVDRQLGPWSSHPSKLKKQRFRLFFLGLIPVVLVVVLCVLIYKDLFNWKNFVEQGSMFLYAAFVMLGFIVTLVILFMACFTIGSKKGRYPNRDNIVMPPWLFLVLAFFWMIPYLLSLFFDSAWVQGLDKDPAWAFLKFKVPEGLSWTNIKVVLNMVAISPFIAILCWVLCANDEGPKPGEKLVRRLWLLIVSLICGSGLAASFFLPVYRFRLWVIMLPAALISLTLWYFWKKKVAADPPEKEEDKADDEEKDEEEEEKIPEQAAYVISRLPGEGIWYDGGGEQHQKTFSPCVANDESMLPLISLMGGLVPTEDQASFLNNFRELYENTLKRFFEKENTNSDGILPDIILQGAEGSGRTESLCAAAVYAMIVRGQNVLYVVPDAEYAEQLAAKLTMRLQDLMVDSYYTVDYLKQNFVDLWLTANSGDKEEKSVPVLPPNLLFATPEQIESSFFNNSHIALEDKREKMRRIMLSYSVIMADDFLEMSIPLRSHLAFIFDKFRLLQASEYVIGQFVVATTPLCEPYGVDSLAERLLGLAQFNSTKNVVTLRPRKCEPFWCGTLRISPDLNGDQSLEKAARILLDISMEKNYKTLFYSKGIGRKEVDRLESDYEKKGSVSISSHLYDLNVDKMPFDTIFYLSLTCGNAAAALRLSFPDEKAGTPVFFRIALENETEKKAVNQYALLPGETALPLRSYHLRSILPFLPKLTPIAAATWSHFGISLTHPACRDAAVKNMPDGLAVTWYYDYYTESNRYGENVIWPYLVLAAETTISNLGQKIDLNILPNTLDEIWRDKQFADTKGEALVLVSGNSRKDRSSMSQLAVWRDSSGNPISGCPETDLAHSDSLSLVTDDNHFSVSEILSIDKYEQDNRRFAMKLIARQRRALSFDIPVRRFSWELPFKKFHVPNIMNYLNEYATFSIHFGDAFTNAVAAEISGLMNPAGRICGTDASKGKYSYDAFMSCIAFLPEPDCDEIQLRQSMAGSWSTESAYGFSSPLTHAFTIALRSRMPGLSFFAVTPVFFIEGRDNSFGRLLLWLIEPYNSGCTVYPVLKQLFPDPAFKKSLLEDIQSLLVSSDNEYVSLEQLRAQSQMAFAGEDHISPKQWEQEIDQGMNIIRLLLDTASLKKEIFDREEMRKKREQSREENRRKRMETEDLPTDELRADQDQYDEFAKYTISELMNFKEKIDLSRFGCGDYNWDAEKIQEAFDDLLWNSPEIFFVSRCHYHCHWSFEPNGHIISFYVTDLLYGIRKEEYDEARRVLDEETQKALLPLKDVTDPVKQALLLHDYIVNICEYDVAAADRDDRSPEARTVYSVLVRHKAVCEGYTMAYRYLLKQVGIKSEEIISKAMCHCWNYLKLNGNWYHVDVTWDDPVFLGRKPENLAISRENFLMSDAKARKTKHHRWSTRGLPAATDNRFDSQDWSRY